MRFTADTDTPDTLRFALLIALTVIGMYLFSFYSDGHLVTYIHDGMDSNIAIYKMLVDGGYLFLPNDAIVPNMMGGMPRSIFFSELNVLSLLFVLFDTEHALIINELLIRLLAFMGTVLLLRTHIFRIEKRDSGGVTDIIIVSIALAFALLPYWSLGGASVAGQPFVLYAFLNLGSDRPSPWNWLVFMIFPFYSALVLSGMFFLFALGLIWVIGAVRTRELDGRMFLALVLMSVLYLMAEYRLVLSFIDPQFVSNRVEFQTVYLDLRDAFTKSLELFSRGQYHAYPLHERYMMPAIAILAILSLIKDKVTVLSVIVMFSTLMAFTDIMEAYGVWYMLPVAVISVYKRAYLTATLILALYGIALFAGFEDSVSAKSLKESWPLLEQISFDRFYFLFPLLWMVLFALTVKGALVRNKLALVVIIPALLLQIVYAFGMQNAHKDRKPVRFDHFYSPQTYMQIEEYIALPLETFRVMSIGLHPSAAIFNGFHTVDGYIAYYPLENKHRFRKIIEAELDKDANLRDSFDSQGGRRCRLMSRRRVLSLDLEQFKEMGGRYLLSAYPVRIDGVIKTQFLKKFLRADGHNHVFLYKVL